MASAFGLGVKVLRKVCESQAILGWHKAKLSTKLFKAHEIPIFAWVQAHLTTYHALPQLETLLTHFPEIQPLETPEPLTYYVTLLENRYFYDQLNAANLASQEILKTNQEAHEEALDVLQTCIKEITAQKYRTHITDVGEETGKAVLEAYHKIYTSEYVAMFGWPYLDLQSGGVVPGDVISVVGRPAAGKTWLTLWTAMHNWRVQKLNVLFVSMEMLPLPIEQRIAALYTKQNITQLKLSGYSSTTMAKFMKGLKGLKTEKAKLYVVDGNLAASAEDVFALADMLECRLIMVDGAYLLRHRNARLDRFTRAAENVELIKRYCTDTDTLAFCSWQFNRQASMKQKKNTGEKGGLEDIGYSDAIGQISSIALGLFQEDGVETNKVRTIQVMKGRNGETGQFQIAWDFIGMSFQQVFPLLGTEIPEDEHDPFVVDWM